MALIRGQHAGPGLVATRIAAAIAFCGVSSTLIASPWLLPERLETAVHHAVDATAHVWLEAVWHLDWQDAQAIEAEPWEDDSPQPAVGFLTKRATQAWRFAKNALSTGPRRALDASPGADRPQPQAYFP